MPQIAELYAKITGDSSQLQTELTKSKTMLGTLNDKFKQATGTSLSSFVGMSVGVGSFIGFVKDSVKQTITYANQVSDLKRVIGASAEESSRLIQVADDVRIDFGTLEVAMKGAITKGFEPSVEGLKLMSQEYLAIQDPIERSKWLIDTFGKSGLEMGRMMELGAAGIEALGAKAQNILSEEDLQKAEDLRVAMDELDDSLNDFKTSVGLAVAGPLAKFLQTLSTGITLGGLLYDQLVDLSGALRDYYNAMGLVGLGSSGGIPGSTVTAYGTFPGVPGQGSTGAGVGGTQRGNVRHATGGYFERFANGGILVGERGPEVLNPRMEGHITPNESASIRIDDGSIEKLAKAISDKMAMARA